MIKHTTCKHILIKMALNCKLSATSFVKLDNPGKDKVDYLDALIYSYSIDRDCADFVVNLLKDSRYKN